jgi:hypothetical protein
MEGANLARISFVGGIYVRVVYWVTRWKVGRVIVPVQLRAWNPWVLFGYGIMEQSLDFAKCVPASLKNLAVVRVGTLVGCPF